MGQSYQLRPFEDDPTKTTGLSEVSDIKPGSSTLSVDTTAVSPPTYSNSRGYTPIDNPTNQLPRRPARRSRGKTFLRWWMPEIVASLFSIASLLSIVIVLKVYEGRSINHLNLPNWLTLNGLVATISTFNRVCLMLPVGSALSQEAWLWFSRASQDSKVSSRLRDLERSDRASRGVWGSILLLSAHPRR